MIRISPIANEFSKENNVKDLFIEVLDARQKILILAASPHPDLAAIKKFLSEKTTMYIPNSVQIRHQTGMIIQSSSFINYLQDVSLDECDQRIK